MDVLGDVVDGVEPDVLGAGVGDEFGEGVEVGHLVPIGEAHFVAGEDEPAAVLDGGVELGLHLGEGEVVEAGAHEGGEVADGGVVGGFVEVAAAGDEAFGDEGDVGLGVGAAADEFLAAGVGEAGGFDAEGGDDFVGGGVEIFGHAGEGEVFEGLVFGEGVVAGAGVGFGVVGDFVAGLEGGFPGFEALGVGGGEDVESGLGFGLVEEGDAGVDLGDAGVIEGEGEGGGFAVGPLEGFGLGGEGGEEEESAGHGIIGLWLIG